MIDCYFIQLILSGPRRKSLLASSRSYEPASSYLDMNFPRWSSRINGCIEMTEVWNVAAFLWNHVFSQKLKNLNYGGVKKLLIIAPSYLIRGNDIIAQTVPSRPNTTFWIGLSCLWFGFARLQLPWFCLFTWGLKWNGCFTEYSTPVSLMWGNLYRLQQCCHAIITELVFFLTTRLQSTHTSGLHID